MIDFTTLLSSPAGLQHKHSEEQLQQGPHDTLAGHFSHRCDRRRTISHHRQCYQTSNFCWCGPHGFRPWRAHSVRHMQEAFTEPSEPCFKKTLSSVCIACLRACLQSCVHVRRKTAPIPPGAAEIRCLWPPQYSPPLGHGSNQGHRCVGLCVCACLERMGVGVRRMGGGVLTIWVHVVSGHLWGGEPLLEGVCAVAVLIHGHQLLLRWCQGCEGAHHTLHPIGHHFCGTTNPTVRQIRPCSQK